MSEAEKRAREYAALLQNSIAGENAAKAAFAESNAAAAAFKAARSRNEIEELATCALAAVRASVRHGRLCSSGMKLEALVVRAEAALRTAIEAEFPVEQP